jgi:hypothetical protein
MRVDLGAPMGGPDHYTANDLTAMRMYVGDQVAAIDSLERRAVAILQPAGFILALGINNARNLAAATVSKGLYYFGLVALIGAIVAGGVVLWPTRRLRDPSLTPPRHPDASPDHVVPILIEVTHRNVSGYHIKTLGLRTEVGLLVVGACVLVGTLASIH